eukprot:5493271-Pleurochrysis_carterae.AAC.1
MRLMKVVAALEAEEVCVALFFDAPPPQVDLIADTAPGVLKVGTIVQLAVSDVDHSCVDAVNVTVIHSDTSRFDFLGTL